MSKKDFNSGAKMGIKISQDIVEKNTRAMEYLSSQVDKLPDQFKDIKMVVSQMSDNLENLEIEKLYGVTKTEGVDKLEYEEKILLLKLINKIATEFKPNKNQQKFLRRLCGYLGININNTIYDNYDDVNIHQMIDSRQVQTTMYQIIKEYLYMANNKHDYSDNYKDILCGFSKDIDNEIVEALINVKVSIFGCECLYEQYGNEMMEQQIDETNGMMRDTHVYISVSIATAACVSINFSSMSFNHVIEVLDTSELKKEVEKGNILNVQVVACLNKATNDTDFGSSKFASGIKYANSNDYLIIFVVDGFFTKKDDIIIYVEYSKIRSVEEDADGLTVYLHSGYMICDDDLQISDTNQVAIKRNKKNRLFIRTIRKAIEGIIEAYDGSLPLVEYEVEKIIEKWIKKISKSSPIYMVKEIGLDDKKEKKLRKALSKYAIKVRKDDAVALIDTSLMGNGNAGILFAKDGIAFDYAFEKIFVKYEEIEDMSFSKKGKDLILKGSFSERKDDSTNPSINDIYFNLCELKQCIEEIRHHV